jgi:hypothetical protein
LVLIATFVSCSEEPASSPRGTDGADETARATVGEIETSTSTSSPVNAPVTTVGSVDPTQALEVVAALGEEIPLQVEEERSCLANRLAIDPPLVERMSAGLAGLSDEDKAVVEEASRQCLRAVTLAVQFVESLAQDTPLTDDQAACLVQGYGSLTSAELQAVIDGAFQPGSGGSDVIRRLLEGCGVAPPG